MSRNDFIAQSLLCKFAYLQNIKDTGLLKHYIRLKCLKIKAIAIGYHAFYTLEHLA